MEGLWHHSPTLFRDLPGLHGPVVIVSLGEALSWMRQQGLRGGAGFITGTRPSGHSPSGPSCVSNRKSDKSSLSNCHFPKGAHEDNKRAVGAAGKGGQRGSCIPSDLFISQLGCWACSGLPVERHCCLELLSILTPLVSSVQTRGPYSCPKQVSLAAWPNCEGQPSLRVQTHTY